MVPAPSPYRHHSRITAYWATIQTLLIHAGLPVTHPSLLADSTSSWQLGGISADNHYDIRVQDVRKYYVEGKDLEDKSKVSLLMSKMSDEVYEQYSKRICPRKHTEVEFDETVKTLEQMFDIKKSLFSHRFACINIARDDETPVEYTTKVNSMCESAMLQDIDAEGWKVFFWLKGLDALRDKSARTYFIRYVEQKWEKKESVNVNDLCEEWKKLLRQNSVVQEMEQVDKAVRAVHTRKDFNRNHKKLWNREQSSGKVDECWNCGKVGHRKPDCVQRLTKCFKCQKTGHLSKYCKSKGSKKAQSMVVIESAAAEDVEVNALRQYVMVEVNDQLIEFQLDTGSDITLISRKDWMKVGEPELEKCPMKVKSASGNEVKLLGRAKVDFMLKGSAASAFVHVREHGNLLGLDWISKSSEMTYHMNMMVNELESSDTESIGKELKEKFPEVFLEGLGTCTKEKAVLTVKDKSSPAFIGKRPVPYGALETVEQELDRLESLGVLKKVNHSLWAAPLVCVKKKDTGALRICADFKTGLNAALEDEDHPIPTPEDVFATLNGGTVFSTVDLKDAYFQIELAEESKPLLTVNTHRGLYQYQRLPFGAKTAPMVFQRIMDKMITGLSGVTAYLDDVIIVGRDEKEHNENLFELFQRIAEYGFRVKLEKCRFLERRIKFLGFIIDRSGCRPDEEKVQVIKNMCEPKDQKTLRSFMGMVTYYSAFIPKMKTLRGPLDKLLMKDAEWRWTKVEAESFQKLKDVLSSDLNLTHCMPKIPIVVAADACDYGIGAVISHRFADGTEKPIAHAARSLNSAEKNYSQIEKEENATCIVIAQVEEDVEEVLYAAVRKLPIRVKDIQEETWKSNTLKEVINCVSRNSWPKKPEGKLKQFFDIRSVLSVVQNCLMFKERVVIPEALQKATLRQLHEGHPGIVRMKQLARSFVYWPRMDSDIEKLVAACTTCQIHGKTTRKVPLEPWTTPDRVWQRIHIDYAGPDNGQYYLVVVDAKSKWAEVAIVKSISSVSTVRKLKSIFSTHGYPETLVSDNGTQFVSREFASMCEEYGIEHIRSPAFHPQSNGQAERFVDTLKRGLKKLKGEGSVDTEIMSKFLLYYRSTPSNALGGLTPAEVHLGRRLRTKMSLMIPKLKLNIGSQKSSLMKYQFDKHHGTRPKHFSVNESVYAKVFERNAWSWKPATVVQRQGCVVYMVRLNDGRERVVHANQLKLRVEQTDECKDELWTTTMFDIFEVPVPQETSTPMSVTTPTFATPSREQQQQGLSMQQGHQSHAQARMPSSAQFSQRSQQHQSPGVVPVRRGNRVRKPVNRYDPSN
uniref:RNA-directed DNA polymerase n=1 Tax=Caenorhabditis japonica TaxID=281687 RepID=A0A8R1IES0_CAEJA